MVYGIALGLIFFGIADIYGASRSAAHPKTWVGVFEDTETNLATRPVLTEPWQTRVRRAR